MKTLVLILSLIVSTSATARPVHIGAAPSIDPLPAIEIPSTTEDYIIRAATSNDDVPNFLDSAEFDPGSPDAERILEMYDRYYEAETGESAFPTGRTVDRGNIDPAVVGGEFGDLLHLANGTCRRQSCAVWAVVSKARQTITIYVNGSPISLANNRTSTGLPGTGTPNFDKHPDGRIYNKYTSKKFPGGDYNGLGNMPYAVFIRGGFAIHGTPRGNWGMLGRPASHGCIRVHPTTGQLFNQLVRQYGVRNTWITVQ